MQKNEMWKVVLEIRDGENDYEYPLFYFGDQNDALQYGESCARTFFGMRNLTQS